MGQQLGSSLTEKEAKRLAELASEGLDVEDLKALKQWDDEAGFGAEARREREAAKGKKKVSVPEDEGTGAAQGAKMEAEAARVVGCWVRLSGVPRKVGVEKNVRGALTRWQRERLVELNVVPHAEDREKRAKEQRCSGNVWAGFEDADSGKAFAACWNGKPMAFGDKTKQLKADVKYLTGPRPPVKHDKDEVVAQGEEEEGEMEAETQGGREGRVTMAGFNLSQEDLAAMNAKAAEVLESRRKVAQAIQRRRDGAGEE